jgi:hypothetical protein
MRTDRNQVIVTVDTIGNTIVMVRRAMLRLLPGLAARLFSMGPRYQPAVAQQTLATYQRCATSARGQKCRPLFDGDRTVDSLRLAGRVHRAE